MRANVLLPLIFFTLTSISDAAIQGQLIVIDSGHGVINYQGDVINSGQRGYYGSVEHRQTFDIAQKVGDLLKKEGARVIYTRTPFDYWRQSYNAAEDNKNRALFANEVKAGALLSIHCDWDSRQKVNGVTVLYESPQSRRLGTFIHDRMIRTLKAKDRKLVHDNFTILDHAEMPALIIETGFLSNRSEAKKLSNPDYQGKVAQAIVAGLKDFFGE